jgi:hypothetical protein
MVPFVLPRSVTSNPSPTREIVACRLEIMRSCRTNDDSPGCAFVLALRPTSRDFSNVTIRPALTGARPSALPTRKNAGIWRLSSF